ncbi:hypothetical protein HDF16_001523 [Granulicella aggregans]|uniref:Adenylate cyclase n=1 Tax=Granulicella aggregans TaxID=474949 RepID=A0A7W8E2F8_9BACT|nr:hypothetical protein [Granulicella aggregans]MBB5056838.1 hypothetical protein [Granulicella aggregans]
MNFGANSLLEECLDEPSIDERRSLIERVASSPQLRRSARLRDFLLYVGGQSLKGGQPELHEQEIGAKVFGRAPSYDRSQDNIVRVNATELRKRIETYFATDGSHETLILEIPRGGYKPVFHRRQAEVFFLPTPSPEVARVDELPKASPASVLRIGIRAHLVWAVIAVALTVICALLLRQNLALRSSGGQWSGRPEVEAFWKGFVKGQQEIDVVLPDASVTLSEEVTHQRMTLTDYLNHNYVQQELTAPLSADRVSDLHSIFDHNLVTLGDFHAAQQILALPTLAPMLHLVLSRYYTADSIQRNSFILLGGRKANPWMGLFTDRMNFNVDFGPHNETFVTNRHPHTGEQPTYTAWTDPSGSTTVYSVIAYLPNLSHTGSVIVLAGTDSSATSAAAEFLTSENSMTGFRSMLHAEKLPYFEVLLKSSRVSGTLFSSEMVGYRTYPETP